MAYNLRIESAKDLSKLKGRPNELDVISVFNIVKQKYGVGIIVDPKANYKVVKVSREVEKKGVKVAQIQQLLAQQKITKQQIEIKFGNGSGGSGGLNALETAKQENASRVYFQHWIENGKEPPFKEIEKVYPNVDDEWMDAFKAQAIILKKWLGSNKGYEYSRDTGIMPYVENLAKKYAGVATKDNWNPADIYIVKKNKVAQIKTELDVITTMTNKMAARDFLNEVMRRYFAKKELVGISLKKVNPAKVKIEESNTNPKTKNSNIKIKGPINIDMSLVNDMTFKTGEMAWKTEVFGGVVNFQIRAFSGGIREGVQMDATGAGASAKLGKVSTVEAIDPFFNNYGLARMKTKDIPKVGQWSQSDVDKIVKMWDNLKNVTLHGQKVNWGQGVSSSKDFESILKKAIAAEQEIDQTASRLSAKIQCLQYLHNMNELKKKGVFDEFLNTCYYGAKKEYAGAGVFLKIYD